VESGPPPSFKWKSKVWKKGGVAGGKNEREKGGPGRKKEGPQDVLVRKKVSGKTKVTKDPAHLSSTHEIQDGKVRALQKKEEKRTNQSNNNRKVLPNPLKTKKTSPAVLPQREPKKPPHP